MLWRDTVKHVQCSPLLTLFSMATLQHPRMTWCHHKHPRDHEHDSVLGRPLAPLSYHDAAVSQVIPVTHAGHRSHATGPRVGRPHAHLPGVERTSCCLFMHHDPAAEAHTKPCHVKHGHRCYHRHGMAELHVNHATLLHSINPERCSADAIRLCRLRCMFYRSSSQAHQLASGGRIAKSSSG